MTCSDIGKSVEVAPLSTLSSMRLTRDSHPPQSPFVLYSTKLRKNAVDVTRAYTSLSTVSLVSTVLLLPPLGVSPPLAHRAELQGWNASFSISLLQRRPH